MTNLFSSFDPVVMLVKVSFRLNWLSTLLVIFIFPRLFWTQKSQLIKFFEIICNTLKFELRAVFGKTGPQGNNFLFSRIFLFVVFSNFMGLFPYVFTRSRHLSFTLTLALSTWLGSIVWSIFYQYNNILAHLVPLGTPNILIPVIVIIETVSRLIRPFTLAVRLAANIIAGHLLLSLLGSQNVGDSIFNLLFLLVGLVLLIILEIAVACIQSYVFTILRSLYLKEIRSMTLRIK